MIPNLKLLDNYSSYKILHYINDDFNKETLPIVLILEDIFIIDSFLNNFKLKLDPNLKSIKMNNGLVFLIMNLNISFLNIYFKSISKELNYKIYSIFIKKDLFNSIFDNSNELNKSFFYLYYEIEDIKIKNPKNVEDIKTISSKNSKNIFYGFKDYIDLIDFYIDLISIDNIWPIFVIYPLNPNLIIQKESNEEQKIIDENKCISNKLKSIYPTFVPLKFLYYVSFIEKYQPKYKRMINVAEFYNIKNIQDIQISHLLFSKSNNTTIRTFLGFETQFRCFHVYNYLILNNEFYDIQLHTDDEQYLKSTFSIKFNLFYLEIKSLFDSSILFSIDYLESINFNNSTFLSFENLNEFSIAKKLFTSIVSNKNCQFKNINCLDNEECLQLLFPSIQFNTNLFYIAFRIKKNKNRINFSLLFKESAFISKDSICSINNKTYTVIGFDNIQKRNDAFQFLNKNEYPIKSYYPELMPIKIKENNSTIKNNEPIFVPKNDIHYIYFQEYEKSKLNYPSNKVRPLFGIKNISDLQRNYFLPNDNKEYTFVGFSSKDDQQKILHEAFSKQNVLFTNALNGKIFVYNDQDESEYDLYDEEDYTDTKTEYDNYNNKKSTNSNDEKMDQNINNKSNENENNKSIINNQNSNNKSNENENNKSIINNQNFNNKSNENNKSIINNQNIEEINKNGIQNNDKSMVEKNNVKPDNCSDNDSMINNIDLNHEINNYKKISIIGKGSYGNVYLVEDIKSKKQFAAKLCSTKNKDDFIQEIHFYIKLESPLILKLYDYGYSKLEKQPKLTMILEYMPNGSLQNFLEIIRTNKAFNKSFKSKKLAILIGIAFAMKSFRDNNIVHRSLIPSNIFLDENHYPKISDFSSAIFYSEQTKFKKIQEKKIARSYVYMAPEAFQEEIPYSFKFDVYSFSMIAYEIITGKTPFYERKYTNLANFVQDVKQNIHPDISMIEDQNINKFLKRCWSVDPSKRPDIDEIITMLNSHIFTSYFTDGKQEIQNLYSYINKKPNDMIQDDNKELSIDDLYSKAVSLMNQNNKQSEKSEALQLLKKASNHGKKEADLVIADYYLYKKEIPDKEKAAFYYKKAADNGIEEAMVKYGNCLYLGIGKKINLQESIRYYKKAVDLGNPEALFNIGKIYSIGNGVTKDKNESAKYFKLSADLGNVNAMHSYALMKNNGDGIEVDYLEAEKYYKMAISKGDIESMFDYGIMLNNGNLPVDYKESAKYLKMAADKGHQSAMLHYANTSCIIALFIETEKSMKKECFTNASKYYRKASDLGSYEASVNYSTLYIREMLDTNEIEMKISYLTDAALKGNRDGIILYGFLILLNFSKKPYNKYYYVNSYKFFVILGKNNFSLYEINRVFNEICQFSFKVSTDFNFKNYKKIENIFPFVPSITFFYENSNSIGDENFDAKNAAKCQKKLSEVKINVYNNYVFDHTDFANKVSLEIDDIFPIMLSNFTIKKQIMDSIDSSLRKLPFLKDIKSNHCFCKDLNDIYTIYEFKSGQSNFIVINIIFQILNDNNIECRFDQFQLNCEYFSFNELEFPTKHLQSFLKYLEQNKNIIQIKKNTFDGSKIQTYLYIKRNLRPNLIQDIRNYLSQKNIIFNTFKYPLQNNIIINEKMIFQNTNDFDVILNEIEKIQIKPINIERNKLYSYDINVYDNNKLFQEFSFICFKNDIDKMKAVNHINSIVYKKRKNVLQYKTNLHYATICELSFPENVRNNFVKIFDSFKGAEDIQRFVVSFENPVERTYIGFDSFKHLKKCYYKFVYQMDIIRLINDKIFWKKKKLKYLMIYYDENLKNLKVIQNISYFAKDIQEKCCVPKQFPLDKTTQFCYASFYGYENDDDLSKALLMLNNAFKSRKIMFQIYKEGMLYANDTNDLREKHLFYNYL